VQDDAGRVGGHHRVRVAVGALAVGIGDGRETYVGDLASVVEAVGLERFALLALSGGGPTAIAYAARNPERVSRLVLYGTWARGRDFRGDAQVERSRVLGELIRVGWGGSVPACRQVFSSIYIPSAGEEQKRWYDDLQRRSAGGCS